MPLSLFRRRRERTPDRTPSIPDSLTLSTSLALQAAEGKDKQARFTMLANTGEPMDLDGFFEPVVIDLGGAEFDKPTSTPVIADHDVSKRIGHATKTEVRRDGIYAEGVVSSSMGVAKGILADAKNGYPFQVSVGAKIVRAEFVPEGSETEVNGRTYSGPLIVARRTSIRELSVTVLGADSGTSFIAATLKGRNPMSPQELQDERRLQAQEELRVDRIRAAADNYRHSEFNTDIFPGTRSLPEAKAHAIENGLAAEDLELALVRAARPTPHSKPGGIGYGHKPESLISAALLVRAGHEKIAETQLGATVCEDAKQLRSASIMDLCRYSLHASGREVPFSRHELVRAAFSHHTLTNAFGGSLDKLAGVLFLESPQVWRSFAAVRDLSNFREHTVINPQHRGTLEETGAQGEIKHGHAGESTSNLRLSTYAKQFSLSRQDAFSDDLSIFDDLPRVFVSQAAKKINDLVAEVLLSGTAGSHWSNGNGNLISDDLSVAGLSAAITALRNQKDADGNNEDITPETLLTTATDEATGLSVLNSTEVDRDVTSVDQQPRGNPMFSRVGLAVEPRLENSTKFAQANTDHWWLFGQKSAGAFYVAFLDGDQSPTVEFFGMDADPNFLRMSWRVFIDFGAALGYPGSSVYSVGDGSSV